MFMAVWSGHRQQGHLDHALHMLLADTWRANIGLLGVLTDCLDIVEYQKVAISNR
jgi:hypothetical protein